MVQLIKRRQYKGLDYSNLRRYLLYWARRDRQEVGYRLLALLSNLLRLHYGSPSDSRKTAVAVLRQQFELRDLLEAATLKQLAEKMLPTAYSAAVRKAKSQGRRLARVPKQCPYRLEQLLDPNLIPIND
jgi:uncharacterized protein DUF29